MRAKPANAPGFDDTDSDGVDEEPESKFADAVSNAGENPYDALTYRFMEDHRLVSRTWCAVLSMCRGRRRLAMPGCRVWFG